MWSDSYKYPVDLLHKSHNGPVQHPTMHHFVAEIWTWVYLSVAKWWIMRYLPDAITGINPEAILIMGDPYGHLLCPGLQPGPPSQTPGGLGQR